MQHLLGSQLIAWVHKNVHKIDLRNGSNSSESWATPLILSNCNNARFEGSEAGEVGSEIRIDLFELSKKMNIWVADNSLGVAWEQIESLNLPAIYWVNHRDKVISMSHPSILLPFPGILQFLLRK